MNACSIPASPARLGRGVIRTLVLFAGSALLMASDPSAAQAGPTYREKGFRCVQSAGTGGTVTVMWPSLTSVTGGAEPVYFLAVLYRWQNGAWQPYRQLPATAQSAYPTTWYVGAANSAGPINLGTISFPLYFSVGGRWALEPTFPVPAGQYAVAEYYRWSNGISASAWATLQTGNTWAFYQRSAYTTCTIK